MALLSVFAASAEAVLADSDLADTDLADPDLPDVAEAMPAIHLAFAQQVSKTDL